jgi:hypothetical protein
VVPPITLAFETVAVALPLTDGAFLPAGFEDAFPVD